MLEFLNRIVSKSVIVTESDETSFICANLVMKVIIDRLKSSMSSLLRPSYRSRDRIEELRRDGYTVFRGMVPEPFLESAREAIYLDLSQNYDETRETEYSNQSYCPSLRKDPRLIGLLEDTVVWTMLESYLGRDNFEYGTAQIALRKARNSPHERPPLAHIDGVKTPWNGVVSEELDSFAVLVGVFLTKADCDYAGNFTVWPGSHLLLEQYFRDRGPQSMYDGMPEVDFGEPVYVKFSPGDVVLSHYQLAHTACVNITDNDRIAIYFRIRFKDQKEKRWHRLTNIWDGWNLD